MSKKKFNHQWERVVGTPVSEDELKRQNANKSIMNNEIFLKACENAGVPVTKRQGQKYNNKKGKAYRFGRYVNGDKLS